MRIKSLAYSNTHTNWHLEKLYFKDLTLLLGASGVGKTRILNSLITPIRIANGESIKGAKWKVELSP